MGEFILFLNIYSCHLDLSHILSQLVTFSSLLSFLPILGGVVIFCPFR